VIGHARHRAASAILHLTACLPFGIGANAEVRPESVRRTVLVSMSDQCESNKLMLGGIQQYPDLLALLASDDAHECRATPRAGVVLLRFCIFHCA
jgi:hypothetical protein